MESASWGAGAAGCQESWTLWTGGPGGRADEQRRPHPACGHLLPQEKDRCGTANQAESLAQGEAFLFLNPDARLYPGWRERFESLVLDPPTRRPVGAGLGVRAHSASETRSMHRFLTAARCASSRSGSARSADGTRWVSTPRPAR